MRTRYAEYMVCVHNEGFGASLERGKLYHCTRDDDAAAHGMLRIVDESGEDYLYPKALFLPIEVPKPVSRALAAAV